MQLGWAGSRWSRDQPADAWKWADGSVGRGWAGLASRVNRVSRAGGLGVGWVKPDLIGGRMAMGRRERGRRWAGLAGRVNRGEPGWDGGAAGLGRLQTESDRIGGRAERADHHRRRERGSGMGRLASRVNRGGPDCTGESRRAGPVANGAGLGRRTRGNGPVGGMGQGWARMAGRVNRGAGQIWACESSRAGPDANGGGLGRRTHGNEPMGA